MIVPQIEPVAQLAVERLLNSLPEGLLIALFAWTTLRLLRKQNSRTRFAVWFFALLAVASVPWFGGLTSAASAASIAITPSTAITPSNGVPGVLARLLTASGMPAAISLPAHFAPAILLVWCAITLVILMRLAIGLWNLRELRRTCTRLDPSRLDPALATVLAELSKSNSLASRPVTLATSDQVRVPAALGLWSPMIVLPTWALSELPPQVLSIVLRHEFAHLERWDDWTNLVQKIVRALFFFHPAVWWIESRLSIEREMACDDVVVAQTDNPTGYASCLISLLERSLPQRGWTMAQALVHRAREASQRLARILDKNRPSATHTSKPALGLIGVSALLCIVALPYTPQLVAFERNPQSFGAGPESATLVHPPIAPASFVQRVSGPGVSVQRAGLRRASLSNSSPTIVPAASNGNHPAPKGRNTLAEDVSPGSAWKGATSPVGTAQVLAQTLVACEQDAEEQSGFSRQFDVRDREAAGNAPAATESVLAVNAFADENAQPTLVFVHATQQLDSDSGLVVWRVQVWRFTVFNTMWKRVPQIPAAHST